MLQNCIKDLFNLRTTIPHITLNSGKRKIASTVLPFHKYEIISLNNFCFFRRAFSKYLYDAYFYQSILFDGFYLFLEVFFTNYSCVISDMSDYIYGSRTVKENDKIRYIYKQIMYESERSVNKTL